MRSTRGMTLIEAILALMILAIVATAIVGLLTQIMSLTNSARLRNMATGFVEQNLERVRGYYQTNLWVGLASKANSGACGCWSSGDLGSATCLAGADCLSSAISLCPAAGSPVSGAPGMIQNVILTVTGPQIKVESFAAWQDKQLCEKVSSVTYYYNY